jgi:hypothetical protein
LAIVQRDREDGLRVELAHTGKQPSGRVSVEALGGFVEQQHGWVAEQTLGDAEGTALSARKPLSAGADRRVESSWDGVPPWGWIDNRPFLRFLHGLAVSAWCLGEHDRAETLCWALLWLSPGDNQGVSGLLPEITAGARWHS